MSVRSGVSVKSEEQGKNPFLVREGDISSLIAL